MLCMAESDFLLIELFWLEEHPKCVYSIFEQIQTHTHISSFTKFHKLLENTGKNFHLVFTSWTLLDTYLLK